MGPEKIVKISKCHNCHFGPIWLTKSCHNKQFGTLSGVTITEHSCINEIHSTLPKTEPYSKIPESSCREGGRMQRGVHSTSDDITIVILVILITTAAADIARSDRPTHLVDMYVSTPSDVTEGIQVVKSFQFPAATAAPSATQ